MAMMAEVARRASLALLAAAVALVLPAAAAAHAHLVGVKPAQGAVLSTGPASVTVTFDDAVRVGPGNKVERNGGGSVLAGKPTTKGKSLVLPLQAHLGEGDYSVLWSVVSDDGHLEQGVLSFSVGTGRAPPASSLHASSSLRFSTVLSRWIFFAGLLLAAGFALFDVAIWRPVAGSGLGTGVIAIGLAGMFVSAHGLVHASHAGTATRYGLIIEGASVVAATGAAAAAIGIAERSAAPFALALALAVLPAPTLAGHSLDPGRSWIEPPADFLHVAAAAMWLGGLVALAFVVPRSAQPPEIKAAALRRFSRVALVSVIVIAVTGVLRALSELAAVSQLWTTGYGRAIGAKSFLFALLVLLGWLSRSRVAAGLTRVRRSVAGEVAVFLGVIVAVAILTALPPGRRVQSAPAAVPVTRPSVPAADATVLAQQDGKLAATISVRPSGATVVGFIGSDGRPADVGTVRIDGRQSGSCGVGCYRGEARGRIVKVTHGGRTLRFDLGLRKPADDFVARATRTFFSLETVRYEETLTAGLGTTVNTTWTEVAPNRLSYVIAGGAKAVVIGAKRWDFAPGDRWREGQSVVLPMPTPTWGSVVKNAHILRTGKKTVVASFLDPRSPAWFTVTFDRKTFRPITLQMTAAAHFMHQRYTAFNAPLKIVPPQ
jgi:copper transport protein